MWLHTDKLMRIQQNKHTCGFTPLTKLSSVAVASSTPSSIDRENGVGHLAFTNPFTLLHNHLIESGVVVSTVTSLVEGPGF